MRSDLPRSALLSILLFGCNASSEPIESDETGTTASDSETGESESAASDCATTPLILESPSTVATSLRNATYAPLTLTEACPGLTGPTIYAKTTVHERADLTVAVRGRAFEPSFALLLPGCSTDPSRVITCGGLLPVTLRDLGPDIELLLAIGTSTNDPALQLPAEPGADPLELTLQLELLPVLAEFDRCGPAFGRCESGTLCLPADEAGLQVDRCRRPEADSCQAPGAVLVPPPGADVVVAIPADEPHSDAHEHPCTGWRRPERVERLELPIGLGPAARLLVEANDARVGLALRGPDCTPEELLACAPATGAGEATTLNYSQTGALAAFADAGEAPLLFIELPNGEPPVDVEVRIELLE